MQVLLPSRVLVGVERDVDGEGGLVLVVADGAAAARRRAAEEKARLEAEQRAQFEALNARLDRGYFGGLIKRKYLSAPGNRALLEARDGAGENLYGGAMFAPGGGRSGVVVRPDHVPTLEGESNEAPGYHVLGRLFAVGWNTAEYTKSVCWKLATHAGLSPSTSHTLAVRSLEAEYITLKDVNFADKTPATKSKVPKPEGGCGLRRWDVGTASAGRDDDVVCD